MIVIICFFYDDLFNRFIICNYTVSVGVNNVDGVVGAVAVGGEPPQSRGKCKKS